MLNCNMFKRWLKIDSQKSALILGPRRAGKTTFLKSRFPDYKYITLDDMDYYTWADSDPKGLIESLGKRAIIDEIQRKPNLTIAVKYAIDQYNALFFMTGSSSLGLLNQSAETLAGRVNLYSLPTACFGENNGLYNHSIYNYKLSALAIKSGQRLLEEAISFGQFPEILNQNNQTQKGELLNNYRDTYFLRDLMQLSNIGNLKALLIIFHHLVRSIGSHIEVSNFAREAGISFQTAKKYLDILNQSQLTFRLYGYQFGPAKRFIKASKTYFADNGIIKSMNINVSEGQLLENFVIAELEKRRKLGFIKATQFFFYKSIAGREIDLIYETGKELYAIEIKNTKNPTARDVKNLVDFSKSIKQKVNTFLFYKGETYREINNVRLIPVAALYMGI